MKTKGKFWLTAFAIGIVLLVPSCSSTKTSTQPFSYSIDSIKVDVSTKVSSSAIVLNQERKATVYHNGKAERRLPAQETQKLKLLAEKLFVKKSEPIILSEEKVYGRTSHPVFTVTLYNGGMGKKTWYDMGDKDNGLTQATTKRIRYSKAFREFMFTMLNITH